MYSVPVPGLTVQVASSRCCPAASAPAALAARSAKSASVLRAGRAALVVVSVVWALWVGSGAGLVPHTAAPITVAIMGSGVVHTAVADGNPPTVPCGGTPAPC